MYTKNHLSYFLFIVSPWWFHFPNQEFRYVTNLRSMSSWGRFPIPRCRLTFDLSLYLIANRPSFQDENRFFSKIMSAVKGGVSCVQLRDHKGDLSTTIRTALRLKNMLQGVPLFINTLQPFDVIHAVDAEGVYLEDNFPHSEARKLLGRKAIIGASVKTMEEVMALGQAKEVDYISVKVSPSKKTCPRKIYYGEWRGCVTCEPSFLIES